MWFQDTRVDRHAHKQANRQTNRHDNRNTSHHEWGKVISGGRKVKNRLTQSACKTREVKNNFTHFHPQLHNNNNL